MKKRASKKPPAEPSKPAPVEAGPAKVDQGVVEELSIDTIDTDDRNDRLVDAGDSMRELAASMRERGLLEPVVVGMTAKSGGRFTLVAGHRRLSAARLLGWKQIRAVVRTYSSDDELQLDRAVENIHRQQLNPVEEAYAIGGMIEAAIPAERQALADRELASGKLAVDDIEDVRFMAQVRKLAIATVAERLGKSTTWVSDRAYLSLLSGKARKLVLDGRLPLQYAREICKVADPKRRDELAEEFAAGDDVGARPGDFDDLKFEVGRVLYSLAQVPWDRSVAFAGAPACDRCPHNSANQPALFQHVPPQDVGNRKYQGQYHSSHPFKEPEAGVCTSEACFKEKSLQSNRQLGAKARSLARRIKDLPKGDRPAIVAKQLQDLGKKVGVEVPRYLDPDGLARRIKTEMSAPAASTKTKSADSSYSTPKRSAAEEAKLHARLALDEALANRQREIEKKVVALLAKDPLRTATMVLVSETKLWSELTSWGDKPAKAAKSPGMTQLINAVAKPSMDRIVELGKQIKLEGLGAGAGFGDEIDDDTDVVDRLAQALGVEISPRPTLEQFLKTPEKPEKATGKATPGTCSVCGCTDDEGCPEGCSWVNDERTLCSTCVERPQENRKNRPARKAGKKAKKGS